MSEPLDRNDLINKFLTIEQWSYRARHFVEVMDKDKMVFACKRIRHDLEELEVMLGRRIGNGLRSSEENVNQT